MSSEKENVDRDAELLELDRKMARLVDYSHVCSVIIAVAVIIMGAEMFVNRDAATAALIVFAVAWSVGEALSRGLRATLALLGYPQRYFKGDHSDET